MITLFPDYDYFVPRAAYQMVFEVGSTGVVESLDVSQKLACDLKLPAKHDDSVQLKSLIYLSKGFVISENTEMAKDWISKTLKVAKKMEELDETAISPDQRFVLGLLEMVYHGIYESNEAELHHHPDAHRPRRHRDNVGRASRCPPARNDPGDGCLRGRGCGPRSVAGRAAVRPGPVQRSSIQ